MSNRFGRNQKRKLKETIKALEAEVKGLKYDLQTFPLSGRQDYVDMHITKCDTLSHHLEPLNEITIRIDTPEVLCRFLRGDNGIQDIKRKPDWYAEQMGHGVIGILKKLLPEMMAQVPDNS